MPIKRVSIPRVDCGDNGGCLTEFVSLIVYILCFVLLFSAIVFAITGICYVLIGIFG